MVAGQEAAIQQAEQRVTQRLGELGAIGHREGLAKEFCGERNNACQAKALRTKPSW